jgi:phage repressor protein C with HTH and peptisase S24 domain
MNETALQFYRRHRLEAAAARLAAGNISALGRLLGYRDGAFVRQMLSGNRAVSDKTVRAIESIRGMEGWFSEGPAAPVPPHVAEPAAAYRAQQAAMEQDVIAVPLVTLWLRAGMPGYVTSSRRTATDEAPRALFSSAWVAQHGYRPDQLLALEMRDNSMEPSLHEGDVLTVDARQMDPVDGFVFAANYEGVCLIRRVVRDHGAWWLVADNHQRFPRKQLVAPDAILIGRLVHVDSEVT